MIIELKQFISICIRFSIKIDKVEIGHGYVYLITNEIHSNSYGLIEDIHIEEEYRNKGYGTILLKSIIDECKRRNCYKIIATSRYRRKNVHKFYKKNGFIDYGKEFRRNL